MPSLDGRPYREEMIARRHHRGSGPGRSYEACDAVSESDTNSQARPTVLAVLPDAMIFVLHTARNLNRRTGTQIVVIKIAKGVSSIAPESTSVPSNSGDIGRTGSASIPSRRSEKNTRKYQQRLPGLGAHASSHSQKPLIYETFIHGNQSLNGCLYDLFTPVYLLCVLEVHSIRSVSMKRNSRCRSKGAIGFALWAVVVLAGVQAHAQTNDPMSTPRGMEENSPFGNGTGHVGPTTFSGKPAPPNQPAVSTSPGQVQGVTRYANGLAMPGAEVVILSADANVDRTMVSGSDGAFVFKNLKPGAYQLSARKDGFALSPVTKIDLAAGKVITSDVPLGASLAVSPKNNDSVVLSRRAYAPAYSVQPASLRIAPAEPAADETVRTSEAAPSPTPQPAASAAEPTALPTEVVDELTAMRKRIDELESELKTRLSSDKPAERAPATTADAPAVAEPQAAAPAAAAPATPKLAPGQYLSTAGTPSYYQGDVDIPTHPDGFDTFSYADWSWMNAAGRNKDSPWSTKYFTPEFRADANYIDDFNHPADDTMGGSTEEFRSNEWQIEQISLGGDIRIGRVRGRILTMFGMFSTTTPRNDGSPNRGQWDLRDAYRYVSEAWGGYHWDNVGHGLNIDAGIFVSYIGLFSYYNFDNWAYQPSYVSSNTPWFFDGLRIQYYPTAKLKIEPWIINGWQSYARYNGNPGLGGQILWRPKPWFSAVFNNYGNGTDTLGNPYATRIHTDDSFEVRELNKPDNFLDMAAMSFTADAGCQYGGGMNCFNDKNNGFKTDMLGWMLYQRLQFHHDLYGFTFGGGYLNNPGRYLTLLPPINGATAITGTPYFTENPGDKYHAYDMTATFDYMPSQWLTFRWEAGFRHADVPYYSGRGGITPPGGSTVNPAAYVCTNGSASVNLTTGILAPVGSNPEAQGPSTAGYAVDAPMVKSECAAQGGEGWTAWAPDLRQSQITAMFAILTRF
jgi:hypothetical protein